MSGSHLRNNLSITATQCWRTFPASGVGHGKSNSNIAMPALWYAMAWRLGLDCKPTGSASAHVGREGKEGLASPQLPLDRPAMSLSGRPGGMTHGNGPSASWAGRWSGSNLSLELAILNHWVLYDFYIHQCFTSSYDIYRSINSTTFYLSVHGIHHYNHVQEMRGWECERYYLYLFMNI